MLQVEALAHEAWGHDFPSQSATCGSGGGLNWLSNLHESEESCRVAEVATAIPGTQAHPPNRSTYRITSPILATELVDHAASRCEER